MYPGCVYVSGVLPVDIGLQHIWGKDTDIINDHTQAYLLVLHVLQRIGEQ